MARRAYTDKQRQEALALYVDIGPTEAARRLKIPSSTISKWASRTGAVTTRGQKTREATEALRVRAARLREDLKGQLRSRAEDLIARMEQAHIEFVGKDGRREQIDRATAQACRDYAVATGILIDKAELLDGRATGRIDVRNQDQMDREIERLTEELAANGNRPRKPAAV